jgi:hypothetical protein
MCNLQLRDVLELPVPRVLAWSSNSLNPVGAEYTIEEKASGKPLGRLWSKWCKEWRLDMMSQLVDFEVRLTSVSFPKHGCLYYMADLESRGFKTESLTGAIQSNNFLGKEVDTSILPMLAIGPLTQAKLWEGERAEMRLARGPCKLNSMEEKANSI